MRLRNRVPFHPLGRPYAGDYHICYTLVSWSQVAPGYWSPTSMYSMLPSEVIDRQMNIASRYLHTLEYLSCKGQA